MPREASVGLPTPEFPEPTITQYKLCSALKTADHPVPKAKYPVVDIPSHQPAPLSDDRFARVIAGMDANNLRVLLNASGHLNVIIRDDGVGMDSKARSEGLGIRGMEERVRELDGWLTVQSTPGRGTTLNMNLPIVGSGTESAFATAAG